MHTPTEKQDTGSRCCIMLGAMRTNYFPSFLFFLRNPTQAWLCLSRPLQHTTSLGKFLVKVQILPEAGKDANYCCLHTMALNGLDHQHTALQ